MRLVVSEDIKEVGRETTKWCAEQCSEFVAPRIFVPAGNTPIALYEVWEKSRPDFLRKVRLVQIDDVMTGAQKGLFKKFFHEHLPTYLEKIEWIEEADRGADIAVLGLGLNGHVAFHEPEIPKNFYSGCVKLSAATVQNLKLESNAWGITYGARAFNSCRAVAMMVTGESKREVLSRLVARDPSLPATALMDHPNFTVIADRAAVNRL